MINTVLKDFESFLIKEDVPFEISVSLKKKTWIHRGGKADYFVMPQSIDALQSVMAYLYKNSILHLLIGSTSNLYILNTTNIPVVISTLKCNKYAINGEILECECGVQVKKMAREMISLGIEGFEYLTVLPGTVAGGICNNSSVKSEHNSLTENLIDFDILTPDGLKTLTKKDLHLSFRTSDFKKHILKGVLLKARFKIARGDKNVLADIASINEKERVRLIDGPIQNLGCTVHKPFVNGKMPIRYRLLLSLYSRLLVLFVKDELKRKKAKKNCILSVSGYGRLKPYVSDRLILTFIWRDDKADEFFDDHLMFMKTVYKTDQIEIEIIK